MDSSFLELDNPSAFAASTVLPATDRLTADLNEEAAMRGLASQPLEVLHHIFAYVDVQDVARLSVTCRHIRDCIVNDDILWRTHYLKLFDEPVQTSQSWRDMVKTTLSLQQFLRSEDRTAKEDALEEVANAFVEMLTKTKVEDPVKNKAFLSALMATRSNRSCFLSRSSLFRRAGRPLDEPADTEQLRQLSAKLHVYYGMEIELDEADLEQDGARELHPSARSRVYDLRRYKRKNFWGPFMDDGSGRVDWEKAQSIMIVLACGLRVFSQRFHGTVGFFWDRPFHGLAANSFHGVSLNSALEDEKDEFAGKDPYNVRGTWMRVVNFLDYHDLFAYNFQPPVIPADQEREPINMKEAIRLILLKLKVTKIEEAQEDDDPSMPRVHFTGASKSLTNTWDPNANSGISGYVRTTKHGDVRWTTISVFSGEERWRSECVQIGGPNSARGVLGNWFDKNYDAHGPAGPTAFWKVSNDIVKPQRTPPAETLAQQMGQEGEQNDDDDDDEDDSEDDSDSSSSDPSGDDSEDDGIDNGDENTPTTELLNESSQDTSSSITATGSKETET